MYVWNLIRTKLRQSFEHSRSSKIFAQEVIQGAQHIGDYLKDDLRPWFQSRVGVIEQWIAQDKMRAVDPVTLIFMIWSMTQHYADFEAQGGEADPTALATCMMRETALIALELEFSVRQACENAEGGAFAAYCGRD